MTMSMYQASVPAFLRMLRALDAVLAKAEADIAARKLDEKILLGYRLAPDMFPLVRQVQLVSDFARGGAARLAGRDVPKYEDVEQSFAELHSRIARAVDYIQTVAAAEIDGSEDRDITIMAGGQARAFKGQAYLVDFVLPNLYFHATTAYAILRHCGVGLGKRDFLGMV